MGLNLFACAVIYRDMPRTGETELLVEASRGGRIKFPGGCNKVDGESPFDVAVREVREETNLTIEPSVVPIVIWKEERAFLKVAYLVSIDRCTGVLRTDMFLEPDGEWIDPPRWVSIMELNHAKSFYYVHRKIFVATRDFLSRMPNRSR